MLEEIIVTLVATFAGGLLAKWKHGAKAKKIAKHIIADPTNPITDPREALTQAVILINQELIEAEVEKQQRQKLEHEERMRRINAHASKSSPYLYHPDADEPPTGDEP